MKAELEPLEQAMLEQTYRFGIGRPELGALIEDLRPARVSALDVLDTLCTKGYLGQGVLVGDERYYFLADRAQREFRIAKSDVGPLTRGEKIHRYAMLRYCLQSSPPHRPLTCGDFKEHFPDLLAARPRGPRRRKRQSRFRAYYYGQGRLGFLRVDMGGSGRYDRIVGKACRDIGMHKAMPPYAQLIRRQAFEVAIVTAVSCKAWRLQAVLAKRQTDVPIRVGAVPEILELIAPPARGLDRMLAQ